MEDTTDTQEEAIDSCPVDCISRISWDELVIAEIKRKGEVINPYANLFSDGGGNASG